MTQRGKETPLGSPSMSDRIKRKKETPPLAHGPGLLCIVLKCSPRAAWPKSTVSQSKHGEGGGSPSRGARGGPVSSSLGLTFLPGLPAPLSTGFSQHLSICMKRNQSLLGLDRSAELTALSCPLLKDITLSR